MGERRQWRGVHAEGKINCEEGGAIEVAGKIASKKKKLVGWMWWGTESVQLDLI